MSGELKQNERTEDAAQSPRSLLDENVVSTGVNALFQLMAKTASASKKKDLFADDPGDIFLTIALKRTPERSHTKPYRIAIPNSLYGGEERREICVFTKDPESVYRQMLDQNPVGGITQVMSVSRLRKECGQYTDKRQLLGSFDLFLADARIVPLLPPLLGKNFFAKKRHPAPVSLVGKPGAVARELADARDSTYFFLSAGPCCSIRIARSSFTKQQVIDNITCGVPLIVQKIPRKWKNVQGVYLKTHDSLALPLFNSLPTGVKDEKDQEKEKKTTKASASDVANERGASVAASIKKKKKSKNNTQPPPQQQQQVPVQATGATATTPSNPKPKKTPEVTAPAVAAAQNLAKNKQNVR